MGEENAIMISLNKKKIKSTIQQKKSISTNYIININVHSFALTTLQLGSVKVDMSFLLAHVGECTDPIGVPMRYTHSYIGGGHAMAWTDSISIFIGPISQSGPSCSTIMLRMIIHVYMTSAMQSSYQKRVGPFTTAHRAWSTPNARSTS